MQRKEKFTTVFKGEREEDYFSPSTTAAAPYISSELPVCRSYINRVFSKERVKGEETHGNGRGRNPQSISSKIHLKSVFIQQNLAKHPPQGRCCSLKPGSAPGDSAV